MKTTFVRLVLSAVVLASSIMAPGFAMDEPSSAFTPIQMIIDDPYEFLGKLVSIKAIYRGNMAEGIVQPIYKTDWIAEDVDGSSICISGLTPGNVTPVDQSAVGKYLTILGVVMISSNGRPYIRAQEVLPIQSLVEKLVSVSQIIFDPINMKGRIVGLHGVLAKGFGFKGNRMYFLADPTGAITLKKLPKLYPTGTILRIRGNVDFDENRLPILDNIEIISATLN